MIYLGVDPGWKKLGWAKLGDTIESGTLDPSSLPPGSVGAEIFGEDIPGGLCMERYVYYGKGQNPDSERILLVTGQVQAAAFDAGTPFWMFKAIEWKKAVVKFLRTKGEVNPYDSLDKRFSLWAAETLLDHSFQTDHEADAACLAWLARYYGNR